MKHTKTILISALLVETAGLLAVGALLYDSKASYIQPIEITKDTQTLGISQASLNATRPEIGAQEGECDYAIFDGCYLQDTNKIRVHVSAYTSGRGAEVLAYEYEHYVWNKKLTVAERNDLTPDIKNVEKVVEADPQSRATAKAINGEDPAAKIDEYHSIACTRFSDKSLSQKLVDHCNKYLPGRNKIRKEY